jgi:glycosyltransferase involved in cell wall biosynthesis
MRKLFYMGLEAYNARYTLQLTEWNRRVFARRGLDVVYVLGRELDNSQKIVTGQVLDAHGRSYYAMSQMMNLVQLMQQGEVTSEDVIYFEDMFQPGFESLPYIIDQLPEDKCPHIFVRCLAQTIDPDDFVHVWGMDRWMRAYEQMVCASVSGVLATNEEMVAHMRVAGWDVPIYNISGLAFGKDEVIERVDNYIRPFNSRRMRVVFSARWDQEKQPDFYMDVIEEYRTRHPKVDIEFVVCSGGELRSNNETYMARTRKMVEDGKLIIYDNLDKNKYYEILNESRVVFNCALQDWVSNTVSEADALGCNVLYPAYRSFPETFANDHERMYVPWSIDDAVNKLDVLLKKAHPNMGKISDYTDGTIDRICDILEGKGDQYRRYTTDYRKHTREAKY